MGFYMTTVCLFVGKLEGLQYSSFWVIFPILLPAGILTCCLCCAVYCSPDLEALDSSSNGDEMQSNSYGEHDYEKGVDPDEISVMSGREKAIELVSVSSFNSRVSRFSSLD